MKYLLLLLVCGLLTGCSIIGKINKPDQSTHRSVQTSADEKPAWLINYQKTGQAIERVSSGKCLVVGVALNAYDLSFAEHQAVSEAYGRLMAALNVKQGRISCLTPEIYWEKWENINNNVCSYRYNLYTINDISLSGE